MIKLKIDNKTIEVKKGIYLIEACRENGIHVPSLCYKKGLPHYTSCMLCMVQEVTTKKFIPSCSALAEEGMIINTSCEEVMTLRKEAVSLLLMEHRAECEAPCKVVCPAGLNIPLMNRYLAKGDLKSAAKLVFGSMENPVDTCEACPKYCEKACRRKMIDTAISITSLIKCIVEYSKQEATGKFDTSIAPETKSINKGTKRFNSTIGKIHDSEKREWLKECPDDVQRYVEPITMQECISEASNCMHCDCRAVDNCDLRQIAEDLKVKNPKRIVTGNPIEKKVSSENGLIFENAKCIKCGLCVRVVNDSTNDPTLCFTGRGFKSLISEPVTHNFNLVNTNIEEMVKICPTGALSLKEKTK